VKGEYSLKLRALCTDRRGKFTVSEFAEYFMTECVSSAHNVLQPAAERHRRRRNGTMVATVRSMLKAKGLPS
jgi:hypothetical protein